MFKKALLYLFLLLVLMYARHLWFVNINTFIEGGQQQFSEENVLFLQKLFELLGSKVSYLEKASHFLFFAFNLFFTHLFLSKLFSIAKQASYWFLLSVSAVFIASVAVYVLFGNVPFLLVYAKWLVVKLQSPLLFMFSFLMFFIFKEEH